MALDHTVFGVKQTDPLTHGLSCGVWILGPKDLRDLALNRMDVDPQSGSAHAQGVVDCDRAVGDVGRIADNRIVFEPLILREPARRIIRACTFICG